MLGSALKYLRPSKRTSRAPSSTFKNPDPAPSVSSSSPSSSNVPLYGVQLSALIELAAPHLDESVARFCERCVVPLTIEKSCSLAEFWLSRPEKKAYVKQVADVFVSYAWKYTMRELLDALRNAPDATPDRFIWLDVLVINQHATGVHHSQWMETFANALTKIGKAEVVLHPWNEPIPTTRSWCVFEHYVLVSRNVPFVARMTPTDSKELEAQIRNGSVSIGTFIDVFAKVNIEKAEAFLETDKAAIMELVNKVGLNKVNEASVGSIRAWLTTECRRIQAETSEESKSSVYTTRALADLEYSLGHYEQALPWYQKSLGLAKEWFGEESEEVAASLNLLGVCENDLGKPKESIASHTAALEMYRRLGAGAASQQICSTLNKLALAVCKSGEFERSYELHKEALEGQRVLFAPAKSHRDIAASLKGMGLSLNLMEKYAESLELFKETVVVLQELFPEDPNHPEILSAQSRVAMTLADLGSHEEALAMYEKLLVTRERIHGEDSMIVSMTLESIAGLCDTLNRNEEALKLHHRVLEIRTKDLGESSPQVAVTLNNIALVIAKNLRNIDEARPYGTRAYLMMKELLGEDDPNTQYFRNLWGPGGTLAEPDKDEKHRVFHMLFKKEHAELMEREAKEKRERDKECEKPESS